MSVCYCECRQCCCPWDLVNIIAAAVLWSARAFCFPKNSVGTIYLGSLTSFCQTIVDELFHFFWKCHLYRACDVYAPISLTPKILEESLFRSITLSLPQKFWDIKWVILAHLIVSPCACRTPCVVFVVLSQ